MNGYEELCMSGAKFLKEKQVRDKIIGWIFFNSYSSYYEWLKFKK